MSVIDKYSKSIEKPTIKICILKKIKKSSSEQLKTLSQWPK